MSKQFESLDDYHTGQERVGRVLDAGTGDLRATAMAAVRTIIHDEESAMALLRLYDQIAEYRAGNSGEYPKGVDGRAAKAIDAIDALKAAKIQNMMADLFLSEVWGHDRAAIASSDMIQIVPFSVIDDVWHDLVREQHQIDHQSLNS